MSNDSSRLRHRRASLPAIPSVNYSTTGNVINTPLNWKRKDSLKSKIMKFLSKSKNDIAIPETSDESYKCGSSSSLANCSGSGDETGLFSTLPDLNFDHNEGNCSISPSCNWDVEDDYFMLSRSQTSRLSLRSSVTSFAIPDIVVNSTFMSFRGKKLSNGEKKFKGMKGGRRQSLPANSMPMLANIKPLKKSKNLSKSQSSDNIISHNKQRITVSVILPSGFIRQVTVDHDVSIEKVVQEATMETNVDSYRVIMASTRAILDLQAQTRLLGNFHNIVVEEDMVDGSDEEDIRLGIIKDLYRTERHYQEDIHSVLDVYAEPLRKFSSLSKDDHQKLFVGIEPILSLSAMLCIKLEDCIKLWDPGSTKLGSMFSKKFWFHYEEYCSKFTVIRQLLEDKHENDQEFIQFCELRQGAAKYSVETLLVRPVQRIPNYEHYLSSLLAETDPSHPDYDDLNKAFNKVQTMVKERREEISIVENEHKMESVQERFPSDDLQLQEQNKIMKKALQNRRRSAPGGLLLKSLKVKHTSSSSDLSKTPPASLIPDQALASRSSLTHSPNRLYVLEGPVQLTSGMQSQDRYLFLFNDLLLVAKQKSNTTFKLKDRVRVCEIWTANCIEEVSEVTRPAEKSFVVGWPTNNYVATFENTQIKDVWLTKLTENVASEKAKEMPKSIVVKVTNKDMENVSTDAPQEQKSFDSPLNFEVSKSMSVSNEEMADDMVKRCMEQFHITKGVASDYQLWVVSGKEDTPMPLTGHEHPYSIKMSHIRDALKGDGSETPAILDKDLNDNSINCQFILRETKKPPTKFSLDDHQRKKSSKAKKSPLSFFKKRHRDPSPSAAPTGKLFSHPLSHVFTDDNEVPRPIYDMMHYLFVHGPFTSGIFRKPANQKAVKDLREKLDSGEEYSLDETNPLVVASTLKEYLRSLPDCLLMHELYPMWLETLETDNINECLRGLEHVCERLPSKNCLVLRHLMCMLYHIHERAEENSMTSYNLAVCISQSLLWTNNMTDSTADLAQQTESMEKIPKLVHFMVDHCIEIFGEETIKLFGDPVTLKQRGDSSTDSDSILSVNCYTNGTSRRDDSSIDSLDPRYGYSEIDSSPGLKTHLSPTNLSRDSGLFSSDNQLFEDGCTGPESDNNATGGSATSKTQSHRPQIMRTVSHDPDNRQVKENVGQLSQSYDSEMDSAMSGQENSYVGGYPPKAPPRKIKRKSDPVSPLPDLITVSGNQKGGVGGARMPTVHSGIELRTMQQMEVDPQNFKRHIPGRGMAKRSTDSALGSSLGSSLGSVEESSEASHDEFLEIQNKYCRDMGTLRKSESGAKLYIDDSLLHSGVNMTSPVEYGVNYSGTLNRDSIQEERANFSCEHASNDLYRHNKVKHVYSSSPPSTRHSWGGMLDVSNQPMSKKSSSTSSYKNKSKFSLSPADSLDEETEDEVLRSLNEDDITMLSSTSTITADSTPMSSVQSTPRSNEQAIKSPHHPVESVTMSKSVPKLKDLKSQSLDSQDFHNMNIYHQASTLQQSVNYSSDTGRIMHSPLGIVQNSKQRKGMTSKGSDLFPTQVRRKLIEPNETEKSSKFSSSSSSNITTNSNSRLISSPRSQSTPNTTDSEGHIPRSAQLVRQVALQNEKGVERSSSETRVVQQFAENTVGDDSKRPSNPPTYQEAMRRKSQLSSPVSKSVSNIVLSEDQVTKQKKTSALARRLYEESQKLYFEEQKQRDYAYYSEPEVLEESRDNTPVRGSSSNSNTSSNVKLPPSYEIACRRSEHIKTHRRSLQGPPPEYYDHRKERVSGGNRDSRENTPGRKSGSNSRDSTPVYNTGEDREKTPTPQDCNVNGNSVSDGRKRNKSRERREGQRLSDTRLENNRRKKKSTILSRSKSDSSEHLHKLAKLGLRIQDSTDSEDEWPVTFRTRRVTKSVDRNASKERLNGGFDIHKRPKSVDAATLLKHLRESGLDELEPVRAGNSIHNRHTIRRNTTVKNKDWHKELAEAYDTTSSAKVGKSGNKLFYQPDKMNRSQPKILFTYNRSVSHEDEEQNLEEGSEHKRRWVPPVHPTKDLVIIKNNTDSNVNYGKDYSLNRSSSNIVTNTNKKQKPYLTREMRSNTVSGVEHQQVTMHNNETVHRSNSNKTSGQQREHNNSNVIYIEKNAHSVSPQRKQSPQHHSASGSSVQHHHPHHLHNVHEPYSFSDSPLSTNSEREDSDNEEQAGLTWSVSKLRNIYDQPSSSNISASSPSATASSSVNHSVENVQSCASPQSSSSGRSSSSKSTNSSSSGYKSCTSNSSSHPAHFYSPNSEPPNHNIRNNNKNSSNKESPRFVGHEVSTKSSSGGSYSGHEVSPTPRYAGYEVKDTPSRYAGHEVSRSSGIRLGPSTQKLRRIYGGEETNPNADEHYV